MSKTRCPTCGRFGSPKLEGYCHDHATIKRDDKFDEYEKNPFEDFISPINASGGFWPNEFGVIQGKFRIESDFK